MVQNAICPLGIMNINFFYRESATFKDGVFRPIAIYDGINKNYEIFCEYLSELDIEFTKNIICNINERNFSFNISSESWGCEIDGDFIKIYFLYDEENPDYTSFISLNDFKFIINAWMDFLVKEDRNGMRLSLNG